MSSNLYRLFLLFILFSPVQIYTQETDTTQVSYWIKKAKELKEKEEFSKAVIYYSKAISFYGEHKIWNKYVSACNGAGLSYLQLNEYSKAHSFYQKAVDSASKFKIKDQSLLADCHSNLSEYYRQTSGFDESLKHAYIALNLNREHDQENHSAIAQCYNIIGSCYKYKGEYDSALTNLNLSLKILQENLKDEHKAIAQAYNNIGSIYSRKNDYEKALHFYQLTLDKLSPDPEMERHMASVYNNIGMIYGQHKGNYEKAVSYFHKALEIRERIFGQDHPLTAIVYNNLGFYGDMGNYEKELFYVQKALNIFRKTFGNNHIKVAICYKNMGKCYSQLMKYPDALSYYKKALHVFYKIYGKEHEDIAITLNNIGTNYTKTGSYKTALMYSERALKMLIALETDVHPYLSKIHDNLGTASYNIGQHEKALGHYTEALEMNRQIYGEKHPSVGDAYKRIATYYALNDMTDSSLKFLQKAIISLCKDFNDTNIYANPKLKSINSKPILLKVLTNKARLLSKVYETKEEKEALIFSLSTFLLSDELSNILNREIKSEFSRQKINSKYLSVHEGGITVAYRLFQVTGDKKYFDNAFYFAERSRGQLLLQNIQNNNAMLSAGVPDNLLQKERDLNIDKAFYERKLLEATKNNDSVKKVLYQDYLFKNSKEFNSLLKQLESKYPEYHRLKYAYKAVTTKEIQKLCKKSNSLFIEYFLGKESNYIFTFDENNIQIIPLKPDGSLLKLMNDYRYSLTDLSFIISSSKEAFELFCSSSHQLYNQILKPVPDSALFTHENIVIVPANELGTIPFESLLTEKVETPNVDYTDLPYLVKKLNISYSYSGTMYKLQDKGSSGRRHNECIAFAPYSPTTNLKHLNTGKLYTLRNEQTPLPATYKEIRNIARYFKGKYFLSNSATKDAFISHAPDYGIIHLALHGHADIEEPVNSMLVFSKTKGDTSAGNQISIAELSNMELNAELVVLSACETGNGKIQKGEGVISIARGFMLAGSSSLVASNWKVEDYATSKLISLFYEVLAKNQPKNAALRQAKLGYIAQADALSSHPYFWSGFVLWGNSKPLTNSTNLWLYLSFSGGVLAIVTLIIVLRLKQKKKPS